MPITVKPGVTINGDQQYSSACFSEDGQSILTTVDADTQVWDAATGDLRGDNLLPAAKNGSTSIALHWEPRGSSGGGFSVSDSPTKGVIAFISVPFPDYAGAVISPNGKFVAIGYQEGNLRLEELPLLAPIFLYGHSTSMNNHMHQNSIEYLEFDSSSSLLVSMAEEDGSPKLWDIQQVWKDRLWNGKPAFYIDQAIELNEVTDGEIQSIRFSPNEPKFVCVHGRDRVVRVWEYVR